MAAVEGETFATEPPTTEDHHKEPSLTDLREMLLDIQITVNNILLENKKISEDVKELKSTVKKQQTEIVGLRKQLTKSRTQFTATDFLLLTQRSFNPYPSIPKILLDKDRKD